MKTSNFNLGLKGNSLIISPKDDNWIIRQYEKLVSNATMGALSATNRRVLYLMPGVYNIGGYTNNTSVSPIAKVTDGLVMDTEYVDIIGLGNTPEAVWVTSSNKDLDVGPAAVGQTLEISSDNITLANFTIHSSATNTGDSAHACHVVEAGIGTRCEDMHFRHDSAALTTTVPFKFFKSSSVAGEIINCTGDIGCFVHPRLGGSSNSVNYTNCISPGSGVLKSSSGDTSGYTGTIKNCIFADGINDLALRLGTGAKIINSYLSTATNNIDLVIAVGNTPEIKNSTLVVVQGGTGIPVNDDGNARNIIMAHCRMNNAVTDADGIGANITNLLGANNVSFNVVDNLIV